jgi:poly [ADP-ribose] polymerase 2/3/4
MVLDKDMFKSRMSELKVDMNTLAKLPLGVLNTEQISKGLDALKQIEQILSVPSKASKKKGKSSSANPGDLNKLTDRFYTVIPHAAKMNVKLPVIDNLVLLQEKYEMLSVLGDIAIGAAIDPSSSIDDKYAELNCKLDILPRSSEEFNVIERYISNTKGAGLNNYTLDNVWSLSRNPEDKSFAAFKKVDNHRLLWHGTKVAVVAAIMKTGLRIMPAVSGSRVGRGIYMANELMKSAGYAGSANNIHGKQTVVLFLVEAALGKQHVIYQDDSSFVEAPPGFDSVLAKSGRSPPESGDATLTLGGTKVKVSQLPPAPAGSVPHSSFSQDEFLVYKEAQQRLRYAVTFTYGNDNNEDYGDY